MHSIRFFLHESLVQPLIIVAETFFPIKIEP
jgi:hypothetical protein